MLECCIDIIIDLLYNQTSIKMKQSGRSLQKLVKETCSKTEFFCKEVPYEQVNDISMGSSLGPVLANIIMTVLEEITTRSLIDSALNKT